MVRIHVCLFVHFLDFGALKPLDFLHCVDNIFVDLLGLLVIGPLVVHVRHIVLQTVLTHVDSVSIDPGSATQFFDILLPKEASLRF